MLAGSLRSIDSDGSLFLVFGPIQRAERADFEIFFKNLGFLAYFHRIRKPPFNHQKSIIFGLSSSFPPIFWMGRSVFGFLDFFCNKVDFTFCDPQGGLNFTRPQISDVSLACRLRFDPKWSQNKMQLIRSCFGDFLLLAHFRRSGLYL